MKFAIGFLVLTQLAAITAFADSPVCNDKSHIWDGTQCKTIAASAVGMTGSMIYSMHKFDQVKAIEDGYTDRIWQMPNRNQRHGDGWVRATQSIKDGDRVTVSYLLPKDQAKEKYIEGLKEERFEANSEYERNLWLSKGDRNGDGKTKLDKLKKLTTEQKNAYEAESLKHLKKFQEADKAIYSAEHGGKIPPVMDYKVISFKDTKFNTQQFVFNADSAGYKIESIDRLPAEKFAMMKDLAKTGYKAVGGAFLGSALVAEEATIGLAAKGLRKMSGSSYSPAKQDYENTDAGHP